MLAAIVIVAAVYPFASRRRRLELKQRWSRKLLAILGIRLRVSGDIAPGSLIVANHISWIDIFVINAACPTAFVSKAEVRGWPLIGWLAHKTDTLFIERGRRQHVQHIAHQMAELLQRGQSIAFFPEGTTTEGDTLLPFHAGLFQPAIATGAPIQPVALRYLGADGRHCAAPAYAGDTTLGECLWQTLSTPGLVAEIDGLPPLTSHQAQRRELALLAEQAIRNRIASA